METHIKLYHLMVEYPETFIHIYMYKLNKRSLQFYYYIIEAGENYSMIANIHVTSYMYTLGHISYSTHVIPSYQHPHSIGATPIHLSAVLHF